MTDAKQVANAAATKPSTADWRQRLGTVMEAMREMSQQTDPQQMVEAYARRMSRVFPVDRRISLSRRDLEQPYFRVTRFTEWEDDVNPWKQRDQLPLLHGGLFADLLYGDEPQLLDDLDVHPDDPAYEYLQDQNSLMAIPMLDGGVAKNMVILTREPRAAFDRERFPDNVWLANLFGRATQNLVLSDELKTAYETVDRELKIVADIQQSLLPREMPTIDTLDLAAFYQTSHRAGGDYYDFFPLPDGSWGILIADVSGHGTPAAVVMAITHSIAHMYPGESAHPHELLEFLNTHLTKRYTNGFEAFVTAFYGVYNPHTKELRYACAGHNPPRLRRCGEHAVTPLDQASNLPLGVAAGIEYPEQREQLNSGDRLVLYTDGITEASSPADELFGVERLDSLLRGDCGTRSQEIIKRIVNGVNQFSHGYPPTDDRAIVVATVR